MSLCSDVPARLVVAPGTVHRIAAPATALCPGLTVGLYQAGGGLFDSPPSPEHRLVLHLGAPVRVDCRVDGLHQNRMQVHGDLDLIPAGASGRWEDDRPATLLHFRVTQTLLRATAEDMEMNSSNLGLMPQLQARDPQIEHIASALHSTLAINIPMERLFAESLGTALIARVLRRFATNVPAVAKGGLSKRQLQRVVDYVEGNIDESLSLIDLAEVAGVSVSHFKTQFRLSIGMPVHQYVIQRRVERAKTLIMRGAAISQVALDAGFAHQSHLARCMRRVLGVTPMELARQSR
ncbi:MAG TPA: AraC family transcriptional regulator [Aliidongia sp.]|uniref:AraC family transcriptional regulator n=1 Tax=Aliidongia sp. TaxID=1914230 RepID=UPI002DDD2FC9|nr:AraC family transcriptional regulator [Aliidongia sp.]HEV2673562.1 AraC family transcriptional regulator [Aliidongia sp.]